MGRDCGPRGVAWGAGVLWLGQGWRWEKTRREGELGGERGGSQGPGSEPCGLGGGGGAQRAAGRRSEPEPEQARRGGGPGRQGGVPRCESPGQVSAELCLSAPRGPAGGRSLHAARFAVQLLPESWGQLQRLGVLGLREASGASLDVDVAGCPVPKSKVPRSRA